MRARHRPCLVLSLLLPLLALGHVTPARAVTVEQIPSPRPTGWAVDLTGTLPPERLAELNSLGDEVKAKTGAEMAVVVVSSTDGIDPHAFATQLFNAWAIGQSGKSNGLLVFAALNDHRAEIILGNGQNGERNQRESATVMRENILPRFRAGDPAGAVVQGALGCARRIFGVSPLTAGTSGAAVAPQPEPAPRLLPENNLPQNNPPPTPRTAEPIVDRSSDGIGGAAFIWMGAGLGFLLLAYGLFALRAPRCPRCKEKMRQLDETADDAFLEPAEKVEERIGSVDYQIWVCPACGEHKKRQGSSFFSRYHTCPECHARTLGSTSTTLEVATCYRYGLIEIREACENCSYRNTSTRTTPMLEDPSVSSAAAAAASASLFASSSSSSSSSNSDASSAASSSSGFSGGDSSGGGASGSW